MRYTLTSGTQNEYQYECKDMYWGIVMASTALGPACRLVMLLSPEKLGVQQMGRYICPREAYANSLSHCASLDKDSNGASPATGP
jgi:hypothetical protein